MRREQRKAETREALVTAAAEVLAERGLYAASLREIAERAGYTKGAIYAHFENKAALVRAAFEDLSNPISFTSPTVDGGPMEDQLRRMITELAAGLRPTRANADWPGTFEELAAVRDAGDVEHRRRTGMRVGREGMAGWLAWAAEQESITLTMPAEHLAAGIQALIQGFATHRRWDPEDVTDDMIVDACMALYRGATA